MDDNYGCVLKPEVGMTVIDDLTHEVCTITRISFDHHGNMGIWVSSRLAHWDDDGGRFPWEISEVPDVRTVQD